MQRPVSPRLTKKGKSHKHSTLIWEFNQRKRWKSEKLSNCSKQANFSSSTNIYWTPKICQALFCGLWVTTDAGHVFRLYWEYNKFDYIHPLFYPKWEAFVRHLLQIKYRSCFFFLTYEYVGFSVDDIVTTPPQTPLYIALFSCLFIYSLNKSMLCAYCVPGMKLHTGYTVVIKIDMVPTRNLKRVGGNQTLNKSLQNWKWRQTAVWE